MPIVVESRRKKPETLRARHPDATLVDVTSRGPEPWIRFSPFYPHGEIPVPLSPGVVAASVEGIWQGLKVFERADVDHATFAITSMRGIKRTARRFGRVLGHRAGVGGERLLGYREARFQIYLPAYLHVLRRCLRAELERLARLSAAGVVVLLDYATNADVDDLSRPLSHAALVRLYLEGRWPHPGDHKE